jgi:nucleoside phosphorylase/ADP-ribose pyrophosphatase YjhB (NUDIX family)
MHRLRRSSALRHGWGNEKLSSAPLIVSLTKSDNQRVSDDGWQPPRVLLAVDLVILTLRGLSLQILLVERGVEPYPGTLALPGGFLRDVREPLEAAARRELSEETGLDDDSLLLEQFGVYGDPDRDPRGRAVSVAFLAIAPRLPEPIAGTDAAGARWTSANEVLAASFLLAFDHGRVVADGVERARRKLEYSSIAAAFCGPSFTISELQQVYEAVWDVRLDPRNFYRKIQGTRDFVIPAGQADSAGPASPAKRGGAGRPARLFRAGPGKVLYPPIARPVASVSPSTAKPDLSAERELMSEQKTVVVLTALDLEYESVRERLTNLQVQSHRAGTRFEVGRLVGHDCRIALAQVGKGNHAAAVLAERAIAQFDPAALVFVGVAGALRPSIALGDVVVATHVYAYHGGTSEDDGLKARPRVWEAPHRVLQIAQHVNRSGEWTRFLQSGSKPPRVVFGPVAAGEIVQDSAISEQARWIREHYNDACAIEMEAAGVAQAAHLNDSLPVVVVRGVSDRADGGKAAADGIGWQPRAAANATAFAVALIAELAEELPGQHGGQPMGDARLGSGAGGNVARDNAQVGVQADTINGGVWLGQGNGKAQFDAGGRRQSDRPLWRVSAASLRDILGSVASLATGAAAIWSAIRSPA